jgi:hypothetical protein
MPLILCTPYQLSILLMLFDVTRYCITHVNYQLVVIKLLVVSNIYGDPGPINESFNIFVSSSYIVNIVILSCLLRCITYLDFLSSIIARIQSLHIYHTLIWYANQSLNPMEAQLVDGASGLYVRFRLGGTMFPPVIYYKVLPYPTDSPSSTPAIVCALNETFMCIDIYSNSSDRYWIICSS